MANNTTTNYGGYFIPPYNLPTPMSPPYSPPDLIEDDQSTHTTISSPTSSGYEDEYGQYAPIARAIAPSPTPSDIIEEALQQAMINSTINAVRTIGEGTQEDPIDVEATWEASTDAYPVPDPSSSPIPEDNSYDADASSESSPPRLCWNCKQRGHMKKDCPLPRQSRRYRPYIRNSGPRFYHIEESSNTQYDQIKKKEIQMEE
jgi:hypothetical protein